VTTNSINDFSVGLALIEAVSFFAVTLSVVGGNNKKDTAESRFLAPNYQISNY